MPLPGPSPRSSRGSSSADVPFRPAGWGTASGAPGGPASAPSAASRPALRAPRPRPRHAGPATPSAPAPASGRADAHTTRAAGRFADRLSSMSWFAGPDGREAPARPSPTPAGERLWRLAEDLDVALADALPGEAVLLHLVAAGLDAPEGAPVDLGWTPLADTHPVEALLGLRAPDHWQGVGVICSGGVVPSTPAERRGHRRAGPDAAVRIVTLLDRAGRSASVLRAGGRPRRLGEAPVGVIGDGLRRALGLPTAPPPPSSAPLWVAWWLDRIVERSLGRRAPATWAEVAGLHPACPFSLPGRGPRPVTLARAAAELADRWPWHRLRTDAAVADLRARPAPGERVGPAIPGRPGPVVAEWMDDGMFARWLLGAVPSLHDLFDTVRSTVPVALHDQVDEVVEATLRIHASAPPPPPHPGLPPTDWPPTDDDLLDACEAPTFPPSPPQAAAPTLTDTVLVGPGADGESGDPTAGEPEGEDGHPTAGEPEGEDGHPTAGEADGEGGDPTAGEPGGDAGAVGCDGTGGEEAVG